MPPHDVLGDLRRGVKGLRIAFGETVFFDDVDVEVTKAVRQAGRVLGALGAHLDSMVVPEVAEALGERRRALMVAAEALVVNGHVLDEYFDALDRVVVSRMAAGRSLIASDYLAATRRWSTLCARITRTLADVDALLVPTTMIPARPVPLVDATPESYAADNAKYLRNTLLGNILNLCAVCLPCGFSRDGLPIGLMIYAKPFDEAMALRVAWAHEQVTAWRARRPDLSWMR